MPRFRWLLLLENFCSVVAAVRDLHNEVDFKWLPELFDAIVSLTGTHRLCRRKAAATKKAKSADNKSKPAMTEENEEKAPAYQEIVKASDQLDETDFASLDLFHVEVRSSGEFLLSFEVDIKYLGHSKEQYKVHLAVVLSTETLLCDPRVIISDFINCFGMSSTETF